MDPPTPKPKRGVRRFLNESAGKLFRRSPTPTIATNPPDANDHQGAPLDALNTRPDTRRRERSKAWADLELALRGLRTKTSLFPPLESAIGAIISSLDFSERALKVREEYEVLASDLASISNLLAQHYADGRAGPMTSSIANIASAIEEQANLVKSKQNLVSLTELDLEEGIARPYRKIHSLFSKLQGDAVLSVWSITNNQMTARRLEGLEPAKLAYYDSGIASSVGRRTCTQHTRTAILSGLVDWSCNPSAADIYWMNGMAGTGKTTIACTFCESLEARKQLAASFFCTRTIPECRIVTRIIPTIAFQLARYSAPFQSALVEVLEADPDIGAKNITKQFERLLKEPLLKVKEMIPDRLVAVIDALDECDDRRDVELFLSALLRSAGDIPLKFFVSSRPQPDIYHQMFGRSRGHHTVLHLHEVESSLVQADIEIYLATELAPAAPTPFQIKELALRSGKLFVYAATLVQYIQSRSAWNNPEDRLRSALSTTHKSAKLHMMIDSMYHHILTAALEDQHLDPEEAENIHLVLRTVLCVREPISIGVLAALTGLGNEGRTRNALQPLLAVVHFSQHSGLVSLLHSSFPDFMFDRTRSMKFSCQLAVHNDFLARRCFELMGSQLRFNICELESSFIPDCRVTDLADRVERAISPALSYACWYWADHLENSTYSDFDHNLLNNFLSNQLLFWMEVLNLQNKIGQGAHILMKVRRWLQGSWVQLGTTPATADLAKLNEDARNFVISFAANPVSQCTPHIYISSLPFCPKSSAVLKRYWKRTKGLINATGAAMQKREIAALATWKVHSSVCTIACSPDGRYLAAGCSDGTVFVKNIHDNTPVTDLDLLKRHDGSVLSIAFSYEGNRIVSGSEDKTIRVWDVHGGVPIAHQAQLEGHTASVSSVTWSLNGAFIISGSEDKTIRVWDAYSGTPAASPFGEPRRLVTSVTSIACSPDSTRVASGSHDGAVQLWNLYDGAPVAEPFQGHTGSVLSVAYSPDGTRIASGSSDRTVRIWNVHDGTLAAAPFVGHIGPISSVAYSLDGTRIVTGSQDMVIRVWDAADGSVFTRRLLEGQAGLGVSVVCLPDDTRIISASENIIQLWDVGGDTTDAGLSDASIGMVLSVACSPDSACVVSSSSDKTIRIVDAYNGMPIATISKGHTENVWSIAYSPDGTRIASGSEDRTIRVWSAQDGTLVAGPFKGHTDSVRSVAFSPSGVYIVSGSDDKTILVWNSKDGDRLVGPLEGHTSSVLSVMYSSDGTRIVSAAFDDTIRVWDAHGGPPIICFFEGHIDAIRSLAYSPDGTHIVSGSHNGTIQLWGAHNAEPIVSPLEKHTCPVRSLAYSPDGTQIVSGSDDGMIRVWDAHDGTPVASLTGHTSSVWSLAYSPDGTRIISGSFDGSIRVWNLHDIRATTPIAPFEGYLESDCLSFNDDGWVTSANGQLLFWVPYELRYTKITLATCYPLSCTNRDNLLNLDDGHRLFGGSWSQCYQ